MTWLVSWPTSSWHQLPDDDIIISQDVALSVFNVLIFEQILSAGPNLIFMAVMR
uniref:Uncharacterized protein n=1 Tax=Arion vulgaris TaxID=1028688 RepID=A0A0B7B9V9_9EUPU